MKMCLVKISGHVITFLSTLCSLYGNVKGNPQGILIWVGFSVEVSATTVLVHIVVTAAVTISTSKLGLINDHQSKLARYR